MEKDFLLIIKEGVYHYRCDPSSVLDSVSNNYFFIIIVLIDGKYLRKDIRPVTRETTWCLVPMGP